MGGHFIDVTGMVEIGSDTNPPVEATICARPR